MVQHLLQGYSSGMRFDSSPSTRSTSFLHVQIRVSSQASRKPCEFLDRLVSHKFVQTNPEEGGDALEAILESVNLRRTPSEALTQECARVLHVIDGAHGKSFSTSGLSRPPFLNDSYNFEDSSDSGGEHEVVRETGKVKSISGLVGGQNLWAVWLVVISGEGTASRKSVFGNTLVAETSAKDMSRNLIVIEVLHCFFSRKLILGNCNPSGYYTSIISIDTRHSLKPIAKDSGWSSKAVKPIFESLQNLALRFL